MISAEYCVAMARYNAFQNKQLKAAFATMDEAALRKERKGFFGSIFKTTNHLLWADTVWMARLVGAEAPGGGIADSTGFTDSPAEWDIARFQMDGTILEWAENLRTIDLAGPLTWYSNLKGAEISKPRALCIVHMFNHQTHHRGQIHAMLTQAGAEAPMSDLAFMPTEGPWL